MAKYLISFNDGDMTFPEEDLPEVARAAKAVVQEAKDAGVYVFAGGLGDPGKTSVVTTDGKVTNGPSAETRDFIGGFTIVDVPTRQAALAWAAKIAVACRCAQSVREFLAPPAGQGDRAARAKNPTTVERKAERELVVARIFDAPPPIVFEAWTQREVFLGWWIPKSCGISVVSSEADIRSGGKYRFVFRLGDSEPMAFFGTYLEVSPHSRLAWTNDEGDGGRVVTTVTFEDKGDRTLLVMHELYPSKEALDAVMASGENEAMGETFLQLDELLATQAAELGAS